jgi:hypothetical protein
MVWRKSRSGAGLTKVPPTSSFARVESIPVDAITFQDAPEMAAFAAHWLRLRKVSLVPRLSDFLDAPVPNLQPFVAISDVLAPDQIKVRLFATGLVEVMGERTGSAIEEVYAKGAREAVCALAWEAVTRPVGYVCVRCIKTPSGLDLGISTISLPMLNASAAPVVVSYIHITKKRVLLMEEAQADVVHHVELTHWIDIGAGTPE